MNDSRHSSGGGQQNHLPPIPERKNVLLDLKKTQANRGLVFDRWLPIWEVRKESDRLIETLGPKTQQQQCIQEFVASFNQLDENWLEQREAHRESALKALQGESRTYELSSRLILSRGKNHPLEYSMAWDYSSGLPLLRGSALKGVACAWARISKASKQDCLRILGTESPVISQLSAQETESVQGNVVFWDAIAQIKGLKFEQDLVNNHYKSYYQPPGGEKPEPPHGLEDPVPFQFTTIAPGSKFTIILSPRVGKPIEPKDLDMAWTWLTEGLALLGIGGKTAVGYGLMEPAPSAKN